MLNSGVGVTLTTAVRRIAAAIGDFPRSADHVMGIQVVDTGQFNRKRTGGQRAGITYRVIGVIPIAIENVSLGKVDLIGTTLEVGNAIRIAGHGVSPLVPSIRKDKSGWTQTFERNEKYNLYMKQTLAIIMLDKEMKKGNWLRLNAGQFPLFFHTRTESTLFAL